jgi:hypothetical protein
LRDSADHFATGTDGNLLCNREQRLNNPRQLHSDVSV